MHRLHRRDFLLSSAATAAAFPFARAVAASEEPFRLNYVLASPMYGTKPLAEILPEVKQTGAAAIDVWPKPHANQREQIDQMGHAAFRELLAEHDVKLAMSTRYDLGPYKLRDEMKFLQSCDAHLVVCGAGKGEGKTLRERVKSFVRRMEPHVAAAEEHDVAIGIENHSGSLLNTPDSIKFFAEFATSPKLGLAMAPYHLPQEPDVIAELIVALGPSLVHFQAWEHGMGCMRKLPKEQELLQLPHRGPLDWKPLLAALRKIDYRGHTEIFMHPVPRGIPILESTEAITAEINRTRAYLEERLEASE